MRKEKAPPALIALLCLALALSLALAPGPVLPTGVAAAAECEGDDCQGPPPAPEEVIPGTAVVAGPPNPPVRFPARHRKQKQKKHKHKHRHHRRQSAR